MPATREKETAPRQGAAPKTTATQSSQVYRTLKVRLNIETLPFEVSDAIHRSYVQGARRCSRRRCPRCLGVSA